MRVLLGGIVLAGIFELAVVAHARAQDATAGEKVFKSQCGVARQNGFLATFGDRCACPYRSSDPPFLFAAGFGWPTARVLECRTDAIHHHRHPSPPPGKSELPGLRGGDQAYPQSLQTDPDRPALG